MLLKENIPFRYIFGKIKYEFLWITVYSAAVWIVFEEVHQLHISIPLSVPAILGTVLSLLLGFRSNQAYDRWWEARHIWGAIVNDSRTLARQVLSFMSDDLSIGELEAFRSRIVKRQMGWPFALGQALRGQDATHGMDKFLGRTELEMIAHYSNVPAAMLHMHALDIQEALARGYINKYQHIELDRTLSRLCDAQGKCERIKNTVFPSTYGMYIHFSLILFIALLPFGLIETFGRLTVLVVPVLASCFLLIEKMAIHLQDPFENKPTDTPVTTIAKNIERDLWQMMLNDRPRAEAGVMSNGVHAHAEHYYIM